MASDRHPGFRLGSHDPFAAPEHLRELSRRLRGRLPAPVTLWSALGEGGPVGMTVSAVLVAEGAPGEVIGLLGSLSDLIDAVVHSGCFVVHVLDDDDRRLADEFAGVYPIDPFEGRATVTTEWGPRLDLDRTWMACRLLETTEVGYHQLVRARIEAASLRDVDQPLVHHHGRYRRLAQDS